MEEQLNEYRRSTQLRTDKDRTYHPVFCTASVSDTQWAAFALADPINPSRRSYIEIPSKTAPAIEGDQQQGSIVANDQDGRDFVGASIEQVYDYWIHHCRPADDAEGPFTFSAFTFVILDQTCIESEPISSIICTTAPDYNQTSSSAPVLQIIRLEARRTWYVMVALEELTMTPTECEHWARNWDDKDFSVLEIAERPAITITEFEDEERNAIVRRYATPAEARRNKQRSIEGAEKVGWIPLKGFADGKKMALYDR